MSATIEIETTNNATVDVAPVANATKKSFPAKYLKVLSIGLYVLKKMHPDVYVDKFVEHMKLEDSIESVMSEIDEHVFAAANELENEVKQIKRDLGKKPKKAKGKKVSKGTKVETDCAKGTTEQIVELANEPTIVRGGDVPAVPQEPKKSKKSKKAAPVVTETVTAPVVVVVDTAPVTAPKAKVTKAKIPKVAASAETIVSPVPTVVKEELDVGEPKVTAVAEEPALSKVAKKAPKKATKKAAAAPVEAVPIPMSDELVEESEQ